MGRFYYSLSFLFPYSIRVALCCVWRFCLCFPPAFLRSCDWSRLLYWTNEVWPGFSLFYVAVRRDAWESSFFVFSHFVKLAPWIFLGYSVAVLAMVFSFSDLSKYARSISLYRISCSDFHFHFYYAICGLIIHKMWIYLINMKIFKVLFFFISCIIRPRTL